MDTKVCCTCGLEKDISCFSWRVKVKKTKQSSCKDCCTKSRMAYYWLDPKSHQEKAIARRDKGYEFVYAFLLSSGGCVDCGEKDVVCLEFDHVSGDKIKSVGAMLNLSWSIAKIKQEISKCVIRCANCHRRKTAKDFNWKKFNYSELTQQPECLSYKEEAQSANL